MNNFAYFIVSYGKPNNIKTLKELLRLNVQYPIYIVIGADDPCVEEYQKQFKSNLILFDKNDYIDKVDELGWYSITHKVCTYSRLAVEDYAETAGIEYIGYLFDDINKFALRYIKQGKVASISRFNLDMIIDMYIDLLNSSDKISIVGPPNSSFYIGISQDRQDDYSTRYGNFMIYSVKKQPKKYTASVLEDMHIILSENKVGNLSICPFGLHISADAPKITKDAYGDMSYLEWLEQYSILMGITVSAANPQIKYSKFTPMIVDEKWRKTNKRKGGRLF